MMRKHIIFDMDGTLSDTAKGTMAAIKKVEKLYKLPGITIAEIKAAMGIAGFEFYRHMYPGVPKDILIHVEREVDILEDEEISEIGEGILFSGVKEMLTVLVEKSYDLYIASTGSKKHVHTTLAAAGIENLFTGISCGEPGKIAMVGRIVAEQDRKEWIMVGDMYKDSEAARANNILALGAGYGYLDKGDIPLFDAVLAKPMDIYGYL